MTMKTPHTLPTDHQFSIMQRILDGTLAIESPEEFDDILKIYTDDPFLHRKYADLLNDLNRPGDAIDMYEKAASLFIERGMNLQAIVAKILQWSIQKPTHEQGRAFHSLLSRTGGNETPLQRFWAGMSYAELIAVMRRMVRVKEHTGKRIIQIDQVDDDVYFVVSGFLAEMPSPECEAEARITGIEIEPKLLGPNDIFGTIFPLDRQCTAETEIRSASDVELVKITKQVLRNACSKYPNIESLLQTLHKSDTRTMCDRAWQTVRRAMRYGLPTKVEINCPALSSDQKEVDLTGIALDISIGGISVDLEEQGPAGPKLDLKGRLAQIKLDLLNKVAVLNLAGKIVWQRQQRKPNGASHLIGIRFDTLNTMDQQMLLEYCSGSVGEQNLLWSLWDTMVK